MEFSSSMVMAYVLCFCKRQDPPIYVDITKAQKLLYCCYGAVMARFNERLTDEHPRAWPYGPVFPRTFRDTKKGHLTVGMADAFERDCPTGVLCLVDRTLRTFGVYSAAQLSRWSHRKGSPWEKADALAALDDREIGLYFQPYLPIIRERGEKNEHSGTGPAGGDA